MPCHMQEITCGTGHSAAAFFSHTLSIIIFFEFGYEIAQVRYFIAHKQPKVIIKRSRYTLFVILSKGK